MCFDQLLLRNIAVDVNFKKAQMNNIMNNSNRIGITNTVIDN